MNANPDSVEALVEQFTRLPSIGRKTARRLASYVLKMPREDVARMAQALLEAKDRVRTCSTCFNLSDHDPCPVCRSDRRDTGLVCVVEEPSDVMAVERTGEYRGLYHVLGGAISPLDGVGPDDLKIRELVRRVAEPEEDRSIREIILAMNPNVEGDTTAYYVSQLLQPFEVKVTRIARGLPIGGDLEFADEATLTRALEGRLAL